MSEIVFCLPLNKCLSMDLFYREIERDDDERRRQKGIHCQYSIALSLRFFFGGKFFVFRRGRFAKNVLCYVSLIAWKQITDAELEFLFEFPSAADQFKVWRARAESLLVLL